MTDLKGRSSLAAEASRYLGIGMTWALATALFLYVGTVLDGWLGTDPWLTLIGAFVGAAAGFWYMYWHLVIAPRERERARQDEGGRGS